MLDRFIKDETGAVAVEWLALSFALVGVYALAGPVLVENTGAMLQNGFDLVALVDLAKSQAAAGAVQPAG